MALPSPGICKFQPQSDTTKRHRKATPQSDTTKRHRKARANPSHEKKTEIPAASSPFAPFQTSREGRSSSTINVPPVTSIVDDRKAACGKKQARGLWLLSERPRIPRERTGDLGRKPLPCTIQTSREGRSSSTINVPPVTFIVDDRKAACGKKQARGLWLLSERSGIPRGKTIEPGGIFAADFAHGQPIRNVL